MEPQIEKEVPVTNKALVIGGGMAGIQAALDLANTGHQVYLVEKEPSIGGIMAQTGQDLSHHGLLDMNTRSQDDGCRSTSEIKLLPSAKSTRSRATLVISSEGAKEGPVRG